MIYKGIDLAALAARLWKLVAMRSDGKLPTIRWRSYTRGKAWGTAYPSSNRITMRLGPDATLEKAAEVVLHELVHCACPVGAHHNELFCRRLIACAVEAFGLQLDVAELLGLSATDGCRAYTIDGVLVRAMEAAGVGATFDRQAPAEPVAAVPAVSLEARRAARAQEREEHAKAKLAEWERKTARAKRIASKWRSTVRYYERRQQAATKNS